MTQKTTAPTPRQARQSNAAAGLLIKRRCKSQHVLDRVNWDNVERVVAYEQSNREKFTPSISVFRWWARRPHSLMGAIIDAAIGVVGQDDLSISDPFSGGGTVAVEAARRSIPTYAQDLYPWPIMGLTTSVSRVDLKEFNFAAEALRLHLQPLLQHYTRADGKMLSHVMRVRVGTCPSCTKPFYMFPEHLISKCSRKSDDTEGFFGCQCCGHVDKRPLAQAAAPCPACGAQHKEQLRNHVSKRCPHCNHVAATGQFLEPMRWRPVLVQEVIQEARGRLSTQLRLPDEADPIEDMPGAMPATMQKPIGPGAETQYLSRAGFHSWGDLYTRRQVQVILAGLDYVKCMKVSEGTRHRLAFALIGLGEMPAFLCRWDRFHQKVFEGIANHRFAHTNFVVETNLLSPIGRGTLPRRLAGARKALSWCNDNIDSKVSTKRVAKTSRPEEHGRLQGLTTAIGSSVQQALPSESIALTLTDPPYFDDVQYGELARIFHFWLSQYVKVAPSDERHEAVPNVVRRTDASDYEDAITHCLAETRRTLKEDGRLILTFHNRKMIAWKSLGNALRRAGFHITALAVTRAENEADHSKRNGRGMLNDLVIECVKASDRTLEAKVCHVGKSQEARELAAMGLALATAVRSNDPESMDDLFSRRLKKRRLQQERIA